MPRAALEACPYARKCGGCDIIEMPYDKQLKLKQERIEKLLAPVAKAQAGQGRGKSAGKNAGKPAGKNAGKSAGNNAGKPAGKNAGKPAGNNAGFTIEKIVGADNPFYYRNKVHSVFIRQRYMKYLANGFDFVIYRIAVYIQNFGGLHNASAVLKIYTKRCCEIGIVCAVVLNNNAKHFINEILEYILVVNSVQQFEYSDIIILNYALSAYSCNGSSSISLLISVRQRIQTFALVRYSDKQIRRFFVLRELIKIRHKAVQLISSHILANSYYILSFCENSSMIF